MLLIMALRTREKVPRSRISSSSYSSLNCCRVTAKGSKERAEKGVGKRVRLLSLSTIGEKGGLPVPDDCVKTLSRL